jgi:hypothetical protein
MSCNVKLQFNSNVLTDLNTQAPNVLVKIFNMIFVIILNFGSELGQIFEVVELILLLKVHLGVGLTPFSQIVESLLIPPGWQSWPEEMKKRVRVN